MFFIINVCVKKSCFEFIYKYMVYLWKHTHQHATYKCGGKVINLIGSCMRMSKSYQNFQFLTVI